MSKDIRSYFQSKKPKPAIDDDEDVIPNSPDVQIIRNKKKESRKKRVLSDDSDEEIFSKKKKLNNDSKHKTSDKKKTPAKPALQEVKAADLFGGPIKRTEPIVKKGSRKKTEVGIHSDEEFEKSLLEVDAIEDGAVKKEKTPEKCTLNRTRSQKESPVKNKSPIKNEEKSPVKTLDSFITKSPKKNLVHSIFHKTESPPKIKLESKKDKLEPKREKLENSDKSHKQSSATSLTKDKLSNGIKDNKEKKDHDKGKDEKEKMNISLETNHKSKKDKRKTEFSEFVESDATIIEESEEEKPQSKKKKANKSLNESVLTDEERHERKMQSAALYQKYLNRSGPKHLGAKEIPKGAPNCLANCAFVLTGVLDSFEREEVVETITKYGGCIKSGVSKKVTHVLAGDDAGPAKMAKARELDIKILNEDDFIKLINDNNKLNDISKKEKVLKIEEKSLSRKSLGKRKHDKSTERKEKLAIKSEPKNHDTKVDIEKKSSKSNHVGEERNKKEVEVENEEKIESKAKPEIDSIQKSKSTASIDNSPALMWVDKYKPQTIKQIIGQHGDSSNVKKLMNWLTKWYINRKAKLPKPSPWAKNDDGGYYKAALLSGPPGVGKTTTVALVCKELGFDTVEFNASDTRSKNLIKEQIKELLTTNSLAGYAKGDVGKQAVTKKHVLVMDEVDGMAGNEDRGGLQELISLIKTSSVPIVCMCNDRNSQKMRSLVNYCYDLRFSKPRVDQIKAAMMSICCKEGLKVPNEALTSLIMSAQQDVRQTLQLLSLYAAKPTTNSSGTAKVKDVRLGPWEALRKVFSAEDHKTMSISDKSDLFFSDYSLAPLFVQENYLQATPRCAKNEVLDRVSKAADNISIGDLVDARIRGKQAWSLLPIQAMYASVLPGHSMSGAAGAIQFPGWLGKNSRGTKMKRLAQEIHAHTRLSTSGSKSSIFLDYSTHLRDAILNPLLTEKGDGVTKALEVLEAYHLLRDDLDSLTELSLWPGQRNPMVLVDSKVKAAMTRAYNKTASALPYAPGAIKRVRAREETDTDDLGNEEEEEQEDSDPENDALIKKKKVEKPPSKEKASKEQAGSSKEKPSTSRSKKK